MTDKPQQEMTLDEWVDRLPVEHRARRDLASLRQRLEAAEFMFACAVAERGILVIDKGTMVRLQKNPVLVRVDGETRVVFTIDHTALAAGEET